ncbi:hypothetical protein PGT21_031465 [Puccinia graminis f. sp. tritici]|uniref:Uncharacterized protein n=1 Tax=Puccinia graminis f. sp. tritici TaxID=56615 RepID=A0A5B0PF28_PUCGR|nr:hypothetical protein PGT21_031465 [Puccinia graminis f. sp. tritici]KAA1120636.1 hypothetical protein PGTUg99_014809 [Puccinia graminis f. sp. tritici]
MFLALCRTWLTFRLNARCRRRTRANFLPPHHYQAVSIDNFFCTKSHSKQTLSPATHSQLWRPWRLTIVGVQTSSSGRSGLLRSYRLHVVN